MSHRKPIFYSALMLTGVNLLLRFVGTSFQVFLSSRIGAEGIGLLQLVLSVGSMAMVAGMAGVRTASMYLTAEELGRGKPGSIRWILSGCFTYSILISGCIAFLLYHLAPILADLWIGNAQTAPALRLFAAFLPVNCLTGVMVGYFTGERRIGMLAAVEVAEQAVTMLLTLLLLTLWAGTSPLRCCFAVVLGSGLSGCLTLTCLLLLRWRERSATAPRIPIARRLLNVALPLALADDMKTGINTVENLMVPKRLALCQALTAPLAAFGMISGMVFPILMFPACILYGLAELLIPELAHCNAAGNHLRIRYLVRRSLKTALLYGILISGLLFLLAEDLCTALYRNSDAGKQLKLYALLVPMLYCDSITDAMTKGLGQQKICVTYNILTSFLDVAFLYFLLPKYGIAGYFISFFVTHLLNFLLSFCRLLKITGQSVPIHEPIFSLSATALAVWAVSHLSAPVLQVCAYPIVLLCLLTLLQVIGRKDLLWLRNLLKPIRR